MFNIILKKNFKVCGLKWSTDGRYLASGGNDNMLNIYSGYPGQATYQSEPVYSFRYD